MLMKEYRICMPLTLEEVSVRGSHTQRLAPAASLQMEAGGAILRRGADKKRARRGETLGTGGRRGGAPEVFAAPATNLSTFQLPQDGAVPVGTGRTGCGFARL